MIDDPGRAAPDAGPSAPPAAPLGRHPSDLVELLVAAGLLAVCVLASALGGTSPVEIGIFEQIQQLPAGTSAVAQVLALCGDWVGIAVVTAFVLYLKRIRLGVQCALAAALAWILAAGAQQLVPARPVPPELVELPGLRLPDATGFLLPAPHAAVAAAMAALVAPYLAKRLRTGMWTVVVLVGAADVHLGTHLPLDAVAGALLGWAVGALFHLVWGAPGRRTSEPAVRAALEAAGLEPEALLHLRGRLLGPREFALTTAGGERLRVRVVQRLHRRASPWYRLRRLLASVDVEDEPPLTSARHETEHEALVMLFAQRAGVRTPALVAVCETRHGASLLVHREIDGRRLSELPVDAVDDRLLDGIWTQVGLLHEARIAHHDLRAKNVLVDAQGEPWLLDLTFGKVGASTTRTAHDLAEALVSLAATVGVERTVRSACRVLPPDLLERALGHLQPLALPRRIRGQLARERYDLTDLRETLSETLGRPIPTLRSPVRPAAVIGLVLLGAAVYALLPMLSDMGAVLALIRTANWGWLAAATATGLAAIVLSGVAVLGSSPVHLPFWRTVAVQLAAAFTGRTTPGGVGALGINIAFLERLGLRRANAVGVTVLNIAATSVVGALCGAAGVLVVGGTDALRGIHISLGWPVIAATAGVLLAVAVVLGSPPGRRRILRPAVRTGRELVAVLRRPGRAIQLFGGALGHMLLSAAGLAACVAAFGVPVPVFGVLAVFMIGQTLGHLVPVPGGLGPVEAMMIAGLAALGIAPTVTVAAVLTCRLLTYWLPVLPGIAAFRYLQHRRAI